MRTPARPRIETKDRLSCPLRTYTTEAEREAIDTLATGPYRGRSAVIREAIALLIRTKHPEFVKVLRDNP